MLSGESLAIAAEIRKSMTNRYGEAALPEHFRTFDNDLLGDAGAAGLRC